jgi:hypothetical protein
MSEPPQDPGQEPCQPQASDLHDRRIASDCGKRAEVAIAEWRRLAAQLSKDLRRDIGALCCLATGAVPGSGPPSGS